MAELMVVWVLWIEGAIALHHVLQDASEAQDNMRQQAAAQRQEVVHKLFDIYHTPEMFLAVKRLWDFQRSFGDNLVSEYRKQKHADESETSKLAAVEQASFVRTTLHYQRRLVSGFYFCLSTAYESRVVDTDLIYMYWTRKDLRILSEIIIPIERDLTEQHGKGSHANEWFARLQRFYDEAPRRDD